MAKASSNKRTANTLGLPLLKTLLTVSCGDALSVNSCTNQCSAYIMWAVTEAGVSASKLEKELERLNKLAGDGHSYVVALAAIVNQRVKQTEQAKKLADILVDLQGKGGNVTKPGSTIVYSGNAEVESTALSMIAWMKIDPKAYRLNIELAKKFLDSQLSPYGYGNTQGTSLTLKAVNMYNTDFAPAPAEGDPVLQVVSAHSENLFRARVLSNFYLDFKRQGR
jgi:hypothetical protein